MQRAFQRAGLVALFASSAVRADWPAGPSQYCRDDAGPGYGDYDLPYWLKTQATPVIENGACPSPLAKSCAKDGIKHAHLGSIPQCGNKGWFCRIIDEKGWENRDYNDRNFGHCNTTEGDYTDMDGHCHGSDVDNVYPWWIRDHWHRGYTGTLHCCCDWGGVKGLVNRCDYRKEVKPNDLSNCRDANEEHNSGYEGTCKRYKESNPFEEPVGSTVATVADQCWTVAHFAHPDAVTGKNNFPIYDDKNDFPTNAGGGGGGGGPSPSPPSPSPPPPAPPPATTEQPDATESVVSVCGKGQRAELMAGGTCPPESHALAEDKGACDELAGELGLGDVGATQISNNKRPKGCYFVNKRLWFNKIGKDVGNGARKSVCCTIPEDDEENDDDEEYDEDYEEHAVCGGGNEPQLMKNGVCPSGSHVGIANIDTCEAAAAKLDLDDGEASVISKANRPKGCYSRNGKLWFNTKGKALHSKARKAICCEK
eukprot:gene4435-10944_t